jgi:NAD(P)-dependent dehydrogenase (short-subunit alcohol dehydrogenase family)
MSIFEKFRIDERVALITGAHSWLGNDMACALAEAGASILITSRKIDRAEEAAAKISETYGIEALGLELDQRDHEQVVSVMKAAAEWKGHLDILINNAGGGAHGGEGHILRREYEYAVDLINVNLVGVLFCCQEAAKVMAAQKSGRIINISSIAALVGRDRRTYERNGLSGQSVDYAASKAGIIGLTQDLAASLCSYNVNVNCISPGPFFRGDFSENFYDDIADLTMLKRWGKIGEDIKGAALFLASDASSYVTGHNLVVDGGFSVFK